MLGRAGRRRAAPPVVGLAVSVLAVLALTGCGADPADDGHLRVVASVYPLQYVAQRVAGSRTVVADLTTPGVEPHDLELGVSKTADVARADLVVYEGGMQPAVDLAVSQDAATRALDVGKPVRLRRYADDPAAGPDPHFWQDPRRLAVVGRAVAQRLAALDSAHAAGYRRRAERLTADLGRLDQSYARGLAHCRRRTVVVTHDAFGYLARFGLRFVPVLGLYPDAEPAPATVARVQRLVHDRHLTTVFTERLASPTTAHMIAQDTGVQSAVLDPIEGPPRGAGRQGVAPDYLTLMRRNLAVLREANGCR